MVIVDAYTHFGTIEYLDALAHAESKAAREKSESVTKLTAKNPNFVDVNKRIEDLDKYGIDVQVVTPHHGADPTVLSMSKKEELKFCALSNDGMAKSIQRSKGRMVGIGTVPMNCLEDGGLEEMSRAIKDLGLRGFQVTSNIEGKPVDSFEPFWRKAAKLDATIYIHPTDPASSSGRPYEDEFDLIHVLGWPFETALMLSRLVFSGVMGRNPGLKIISHHMGGMIPYMAGRLVESYARTWTRRREDQVQSAKLPKGIMESFGDFYYDTAVGGSIPTIQCGVGVFGADRIVFSTDYPWGPDSGRGRLGSYPGLIRDCHFEKGEEDKIFSGNISRLLGI